MESQEEGWKEQNPPGLLIRSLFGVILSNPCHLCSTILKDEVRYDSNNDRQRFEAQ